MKKIKEILKKIRKYLKEVFSKKNVKLLGEPTSVDNYEEIKNRERYMQEKEEFLHLYNNVKKGKIKITDLMLNDMIKVQLMMNEEQIICDEKIHQKESKLSELVTEMTLLKKDKVIYEKKLGKS